MPTRVRPIRDDEPEEDEDKAEPTTGKLMGKPAVINRPDLFRFAPDSEKDIVQRDLRGWVGQRIPPGAVAKPAARGPALIVDSKLSRTLRKQWQDIQVKVSRGDATPREMAALGVISGLVMATETARLPARMQFAIEDMPERRLRKLIDKLTAEMVAGRMVGSGDVPDWLLRHPALLDEAVFDTPVYRNVDLIQIAQALAAAARQRPLNLALIHRLGDRLAAAVELAVVAVRGRSDGSRFSSILRAAIASLEDGIDVRMESEGIDPLRGTLSKLRGVMVDCSQERAGAGGGRGDGDRSRNARAARASAIRLQERAEDESVIRLQERAEQRAKDERRALRGD